MVARCLSAKDVNTVAKPQMVGAHSSPQIGSITRYRERTRLHEATKTEDSWAVVDVYGIRFEALAFRLWADRKC